MDMDVAGTICGGGEGLLMAEVVQRLICEEKGQGLAEYAIIVAAVALLVVGSLTALGLKVRALFEEVQFPPL